MWWRLLHLCSIVFIRYAELVGYVYIQLVHEIEMVKGPCTYDVHEIFGILDPPPPCPHFTQPISTVRPQNWPILEPPPPPSLWTSYVHGPLRHMVTSGVI